MKLFAEVNIVAVTFYLVTLQYLNINRYIKSTNWGPGGGRHSLIKFLLQRIIPRFFCAQIVTNSVQFVGRFQTEATVQYDGKYYTVASTNENA